MSWGRRPLLRQFQPTADPLLRPMRSLRKSPEEGTSGAKKNPIKLVSLPDERIAEHKTIVIGSWS